ncbi:MAG: DUF2179 domain-containing protein [Clostridia bacterium]|nr:DUF2179 domain-containing protein [Clostridia bacterium]
MKFFLSNYTVCQNRWAFRSVWCQNGDVFGSYTESKKTMIHAVCGRFEATKLRKKIKTIDQNAFIIITTGSEILGSGFMNL